MNYLSDVEIDGHIPLINMTILDYIDNYDVIYCPESGSMCNTTRDCVFCLYRNNYLDEKSRYKPKDKKFIIT